MTYSCIKVLLILFIFSVCDKSLQGLMVVEAADLVTTKNTSDLMPFLHM